MMKSARILCAGSLIAATVRSSTRPSPEEGLYCRPAASQRYVCGIRPHNLRSTASADSYLSLKDYWEVMIESKQLDRAVAPSDCFTAIRRVLCSSVKLNLKSLIAVFYSPLRSTFAFRLTRHIPNLFSHRMQLSRRLSPPSQIRLAPRFTQ
ncbi:hypothetical protein F4604DRAFT_582375 [Suillus subluteus]|nr:hypothetical protein F4604DRAFT_582375 [Suillus subluteus]